MTLVDEFTDDFLLASELELVDDSESVDAFDEGFLFINDPALF